MGKIVWTAMALIGMMASGGIAKAQSQNKTPEKPSISSVLDRQLSIEEREFTSAAEAMPADKYNFAPTNGDFKGVRNFGAEVRHVASFNYLFYSEILGQNPPAGSGAEGPENVNTKDEILRYLHDSFALGHRAIASITPENALIVLPKAAPRTIDTRLAVAVLACVHDNDHYGQMVEYLRMNGIVPPATAAAQSRTQGSR